MAVADAGAALVKRFIAREDDGAARFLVKTPDQVELSWLKELRFVDDDEPAGVAQRLDDDPIGDRLRCP